MQLAYRSILGSAILTLGVLATAACGGDDSTSGAAASGGATTATGTGGAGGATTATGSGGAGGAGGATGAGGGGGMPMPEPDTFVFYGDYKTAGVEEIGVLTIPGMTSSIMLPGVTKLEKTYDIAQSPDTKLLAIALRADGGAPKVIVRNADGSGTPKVVADFTGQVNTPANTAVSGLAFSPDGKLLVLKADSAVNGQALVYVVPVDGSMTKPKLVSPSAGATQEVTTIAIWLDATHLAFGGDLITNDAANLFTVDVTAAMPMPALMQNTLTTGDAGKNVRGPLYLGADSKIYFRSSHVEAGKALIYRCDLNGMNVQPVPAATVLNNNVAAPVSTFRISRDRTQLALAIDEKSNGLQQIYVAKLDDAAPTKRTAFATAPAAMTTFGVQPGAGTFVWSPDGASLAVVADWPVDAAKDKDNDYALFLVPTTGNPGATRLLNVPPGMKLDVDGVTWSRDAKRLVVLGDLVADNNFELYATTDLVTANQSAMNLRVVEVPKDGDVWGVQTLVPVKP